MAARSLVGKFSKLIAQMMPQWQEDQSSLIFSPYAGSLIGAQDLVCPPGRLFLHALFLQECGTGDVLLWR